MIGSLYKLIVVQSGRFPHLQAVPCAYWGWKSVDNFFYRSPSFFLYDCILFERLLVLVLVYQYITVIVLQNGRTSSVMKVLSKDTLLHLSNPTDFAVVVRYYQVHVEVLFSHTYLE